MLPIAAIDRLARKAGTERISAKALKEIQKIMDDLALELALETANMAKHAGRKTITKEDIRLVAEKA